VLEGIHLSASVAAGTRQPVMALPGRELVAPVSNSEVVRSATVVRREYRLLSSCVSPLALRPQASTSPAAQCRIL
jgi:hypothetical protein